jgi:hypothetical protein
LSEDPDLAGLRTELSFRRFESERLPSARAVPVRPADIVRLTASRFSTRLCTSGAELVERVWHDRSELQAVDIHDVIAWWRDEETCWRLMQELSHHHRHWQTRLDVIRAMTSFAGRYEAGADFRLVHAPYGEDAIAGAPAAVDRLARHETHFADLRMRALARALGEPDAGPLPGFDSWMSYFLTLDERGEEFDLDDLRRLANNRAAAWSALRLAFEERRTDEESPHERFEREFDAMLRSLLAFTPPSGGVATPA